MHKKVYASAYKILQTLLTKMRKINNDIATQTIYATNLFSTSVRVFSLSGRVLEVPALTGHCKHYHWQALLKHQPHGINWA